MNCPYCKKENSEESKFCKYCGTALIRNFITCENGHNYSSDLKECPFCPSQNLTETLIDNEKTALDVNSNQSDKTQIEPTIQQSNLNSPSYDDKTVLLSSDETRQKSVGRKLIGWLVTFDLNPNGTDYRLYEGKNLIGSAPVCDIIIPSPSVSKKHCTILFRPIDNKLIIKDELSTNGTFVNEVLIDENIILKNDDIIKVGSISLKLKLI